MTPADKLEALEAEIRQQRTLSQFMGPNDMALALMEERAEIADRLAAIRAELGEAVPTHWMVSNEVFTSLSEAIEEIQQWGPSGSIAVPLYTTPPASVPVEALRGLVDKWRARTLGHDLHADELTALIAAQEKP